MKKYNIFVHVVSNVIIIAVLFGLYLACVPPKDGVSASAPIYKGDGNDKKVALMVNVYQGSEYVEGILEVLERYDAVCTFFVGGIWTAKNMELTSRITERNEIGNHGYLHLDHAKISARQNREEIELCDRLVQKVTGKKMRLFAPPSGSIGNQMLSVCEELGYKVVMWSKDTIDWRDKDHQLIYKRATKDIQNGDFILMHPTEQTLKALPAILDFYATQGFETATVTELMPPQDAH